MPKQILRDRDVSQHEMFPPAFRDLVLEIHLLQVVRRVVVEDLDLTRVHVKYTGSRT